MGRGGLQNWSGGGGGGVVKCHYYEKGGGKCLIHAEGVRAPKVLR